MALIASKFSVDVEKTDAAAIVFTAVTKANPGVATSVAHGLLNGAIGVWTAEGMSELEGQVCRVANKTADTIELEGLDTTNYGTFTSGSFTPITAYDRYGDATALNATQGNPSKIDVTKTIDSSKQYEYGIPDAVELKLSGLLNPSATAVLNLQAAARTGTAKVLKLTYRNGKVLYVNCSVGGGEGFGGNSGDKLTNDFVFSAKQLLQWF